MSEENLELVRRALEAYNSGDVDALVDLFTDDGEVETDPRFPEGGTFSGREPVRRFIAGLRDGRIARLRFFYDRAAAVEAAGLSE